jgi:hypothetical protein
MLRGLRAVSVPISSRAVNASPRDVLINSQGDSELTLARQYGLIPGDIEIQMSGFL